jgi:hypothetical protein
MSANIYSIESLLENSYYRSRSLDGQIVHAEIDNRAVWYGENTRSYLVRVIPSNGGKSQWRTLAVSLGE